MRCPNCETETKKAGTKDALIEFCPKPGCGFTAPASKVKIETVWVYCVTDKDGNDGIPALRMDNLSMPMIGGDLTRIKMYKQAAAKLEASGMHVKLFEFTQRKEIDWKAL